MVKILSSKAIADPNRVPIGTDPQDALFEQMQSSPGTFIPGTTPTNMTVTPAGGITNIAGLANSDRYKSFIREGEAGYESTPGQLGMVDPGIRYDPRQHSYASDLYQYYLTGEMPPGGETGDVMPSGPITRDDYPADHEGPMLFDQGTGITAAGVPIPVMPPMGGAQNPLTQMITDPITGQTQTVKQAMTTDDAYVYDPSLDSIVDGVPTTFSPPGGGRNISQEEFLTGQIGRQNVTGDITDYIDPIDLDVTSLSPAAATIPAALTAGRIAKDAAGNWLYRGAAPGTKAATQAAAKGATAGQIGKAIWKEGAFGVKGPKGLGTTNVGFDPAYKGAGATGRAGYIGQGLKSLTGAAAAGNIAGGTPAQRLAFEKLAQSGAARGIAGAARFAGLTTPVGAAVTAATLTPTIIDALTKRDPDATETSLFGMDLQDLEDRAAAYDAGETATLDDWGSPMGDVPDPTVTGITGPAGMEPDFYAENESAIRSGMGPTMADVAGPVQNITTASGDTFAANDPQLLEKVDPETKTNTNYVADLWNKAKGSVADFKTSLQDAGKFSAMQIGSLVNAFTNPSAMSLAGAAGIPGMILAAFAGAGTQVSPEQRAANAAFEQKHGINVGADGRITGGPLQGKVPAGKSFAGSATYEEMLDKKIDYFEKRIEEGKSYSDKNYQEAKALRGEYSVTRPPGIDAPMKTSTKTEAEEDETDLMTFEQLGGWLGQDDKVPGEPTGIEGPPSEISGTFTPTGPTGADVHGTVEPTKTTTTTTPSDGGFGDTPGPRGGGGRDSAPSGPTGGPPGGGDPGMRSAPSAPAGGPHGGGGMDIGRGSPGSMPTGTGGPPSRGGRAGGPPSQGGGGGNGGCFVKGTPITMADGSTKPVEQVDLGDEVAEGGKVFAAGRFLTEELHDYEGIKVSGSHMVNEDGTWVRVRDSEKGKPLGDDEHTVYVFGAENRRILIKGILFTDYFEVKEQDQLATMGDKYFQVWRDHDKIFLNLEEQNNVTVLNAN